MLLLRDLPQGGTDRWRRAAPGGRSDRRSSAADANRNRLGHRLRRSPPGPDDGARRGVVVVARRLHADRVSVTAGTPRHPSRSQTPLPGRGRYPRERGPTARSADGARIPARRSRPPFDAGQHRRWHSCRFRLTRQRDPTRSSPDPRSADLALRRRPARRATAAQQLAPSAAARAARADRAVSARARASEPSHRRPAGAGG